MAHPVQQFVTFFNTFIWKRDIRSLTAVQHVVVQGLRLIYVMVRDLAAGDLNLRAMSLVYTTLLSLVPLLAVSFSVLKGFGVHNQVEPLLLNFLEPLGPKGVELAGHIIGFVENVKVTVLGGVGLALLIYTVLSLLQKIEASFNYVWRIERLRSLSQRFSSYLSVILIGPVLIFSALGVTASVMNTNVIQFLLGMETFGALFLHFSKLMPYLLVSIAFTFIYIFIPNTNVKFTPAVIGGLIAGALWQSTGWAFAAFIASSTKYAAIYSSFAILVLLLIWLYINWLVLLLGAQIAFYIQHPQYMAQHRVRLQLSNRLKEHLALAIMYLVGYNHYYNRPAWRLDQLAEHLSLPPDPVGRLVDNLVAAGYLSESGTDPVAYLPARAIETMKLSELIDVVRQVGESEFVSEEHMTRVATVDQVMQRSRQAVCDVLSEETVRDLVLSGEKPLLTE